MKLANSEFNRYPVQNADDFDPVIHEDKMMVARPDFYMSIMIILVLAAIGYYIWTKMKEPKPEDTPLNDSVDMTADNKDNKDQVQLNNN